MSGSQLFETHCILCTHFVECGAINRTVFACKSFKSKCEGCKVEDCSIKKRYE